MAISIKISTVISREFNARLSQEKVSNIYDVDAYIPKHVLSPNIVYSMCALWDKLYELLSDSSHHYEETLRS